MTDTPTAVPAERVETVVPYATLALAAEAGPDITRPLLWGGVVFAILELMSFANSLMHAWYIQSELDAWRMEYLFIATGAAVALGVICAAALRGKLSVPAVRISIACLVIVVTVAYGAWLARPLLVPRTTPLRGTEIAARVTARVIIIARSQFWPIAMVWCLKRGRSGESTTNGVARLCFAAAMLGIEKSLSAWVEFLAYLPFRPWDMALKASLYWLLKPDGFLYLLHCGCATAGAVLCWLAASRAWRRRILITLAMCLMLVPAFVIETRRLLARDIPFVQLPSYPLVYVLVSSGTRFGISCFTVLALTFLVWTTKHGVARAAESKDHDA